MPVMRPLQSASYRSVPAVDHLFSFGIDGTRREDLPVRPFEFPESIAPTCEQSGSERRRFDGCETFHLQSRQVCLELHKEIVLRHSSVDLHDGGIASVVRCHGFQKIVDLECYGFQDRTHYLSPAGCPGDTDGGRSCILRPIWRCQTRECRYEITPSRIAGILGYLGTFFRRVNEPYILQPFDGRSGRICRTFQSIGCLPPRSSMPPWLSIRGTE